MANQKSRFVRSPFFRSASKKQNASKISLNQRNIITQVRKGLVNQGIRGGKFVASRIRHIISPQEVESAIYKEEMRQRREEIVKIREEIARMLNINPAKLGRDRKIEAISIALHEIYGTNIPREKLRQINLMLMNEFSRNSPFLKQSPTIRKILERAEMGLISTRKNAQGYSEVDILTQAISDLVEKHELN